MTNKSNNLYAFGYGLSLLIPFLVFVHALHIDFSYGVLAIFLGCFFGILFVVSKMAKSSADTGNGLRQLWVLLVQGGVLYGVFLNEPSLVKILLVVTAILIFMITLNDVNLLEPIYQKWMMVTQLISKILTGTILTLLYFFVFGIIGIVLRLLGKDHLDRKLDDKVGSYWIPRDTQVLDKASYEKQY